MKQPTEDQIIKDGAQLSDSQSWGSYDKKTGWSEKVATGAAVRQYIQNLKQLIINLQSNKVNKKDYDTALSNLTTQINSKVATSTYNSDKQSTATQIQSILNNKTNNIVTTSVTPGSNQRWVDDEYKEITISNGDGNTSKFIVLTKRLQTVKVWFKASDTALTSSDFNTLGTAEQSSNSYSKTFNTKHYYVVLESGHTLQSVTNDHGMNYLSQFNSEEITKQGYIIYHYSRVVGVSVKFNFKIS